MDTEIGFHPDWLPQHQYPFESRYIRIDGSTIHYIDEGEGPLFLFLHGNPTFSFLYRHIIGAMRDRYRCVALDYPGFGLSQPATNYGFTPEEHGHILASFIEKLDLSGIHMMVQDWGGPIGMSVAVQMPERFNGFVIGNTWAWSVKGDTHFEFFSRSLGSPIGKALITQANGFVNLVMPRGVAKKPIPPEIMDIYRAQFPTGNSRLPTWVFPKEIIGATDWLRGIQNNLHKIADKPALIVWGDKDIAFRKEELEHWLSILTNSTLFPLKGAGHYIQEDAPYEIVQAIDNWMENND